MSDKTSFSCGEAIDIVHVESIRQRLIKAVSKANIIELKAHEVSKADTAGLQIFVALNQQLTNAGGQIVWKKPSPALLHSASLLGLSQALSLPESA